MYIIKDKKKMYYSTIEDCKDDENTEACGICWPSLLFEIIYYLLEEIILFSLILFLIRPDNRLSKDMMILYNEAKGDKDTTEMTLTNN